MVISWIQFLFFYRNNRTYRTGELASFYLTPVIFVEHYSSETWVSYKFLRSPGKPQSLAPTTTIRAFTGIFVSLNLGDQPEVPRLGDFFWPKCSMYGMFTYIYHKFKPNVGKYSIHGASGLSTQKRHKLVNRVFSGFLAATNKKHELQSHSTGWFFTRLLKWANSWSLY